MNTIADYSAGAEETEKLKNRIRELEEEKEKLEEIHRKQITELENKLETAELYGSNALEARSWKTLYVELKQAVQGLGIGVIIDENRNVIVSLSHGEILVELAKLGKLIGQLSAKELVVIFN